jgi:hypothetical protein
LIGRIWSGRRASTRLQAAEEALVAAGATPRAAALLVGAGYTSSGAIRGAAWTDEQAGRAYESAEWRVSVQPGFTRAALEEVRSFRDRLMAAEPPPPRS